MRTILTVGLFMLLAQSVLATFVGPDLVDVPIATLIANAEKKAAANPKNAQLHYVVGRLESLAYAQKATLLKVDRRTQMPYLDMGTPPGGVVPATSAAARAAAQRHLDRAIAEYAVSMKLDPSLLGARLGYGWCLLQAGRKDEARKTLSDLYDVAVKQELARTSWGPLAVCWACETGRYLIPLLDKQRDAARIAQMDADIKKLKSMPRAITPILVPLADVPFERLVDRSARVSFDLDGSGERRAWQWITPQAGWLVYAGSGERKPDDGTRFVGARMFWVFWDNGYEALAAFDRNGDNVVEGDELAGLAVWRDANSDGRVDGGEIVPLAALGIVGLACDNVPHPQGFLYSPGGIRYADGRRRDSYDWIPTSILEGVER